MDTVEARFPTQILRTFTEIAGIDECKDIVMTWGPNVLPTKG